MSSPQEGQDTKVVRIKQFDEFSKDEKLFADPELEGQIDAMESEAGFAQRIADRVMGALKPEDDPSDRQHNVIGRRRMHQRLRNVTLANQSRDTADAPGGKIIRFAPRIKKP